MTTRTLLLSTLALALFTGTASAQSASAEAETLFKQARELMAQKKYNEACDAFASSQKLDASATTLYSLAVCRELDSKLASAWGTLIDFERQYRSSTDPAVVELVKKARERAKALEPRLSSLTISVPEASRAGDLAIERDGAAVDRGVWDRPLPVDGGSHTIAVRRPGYQAWTTTVTVAPEGEAQKVSIPALEPAPVTTPDPTKPLPPSKPMPLETQHRSKVLPIAFAGGAVALGGAALGFELWGRSLHDDAQKTLDGGDETRANQQQQTANKRRYLAQGFGIAAIGCAGVAVFLFLRPDPTGDSAAQSALRHVVPVANQDQVGIGVLGQW
jgi:hypothetical protein